MFPLEKILEDCENCSLDDKGSFIRHVEQVMGIFSDNNIETPHSYYLIADKKHNKINRVMVDPSDTCPLNSYGYQFLRKIIPYCDATGFVLLSNARQIISEILQ